MGNIANVRIGVCSITFGGVDLGHTLGGVMFDYEPTYTDIKVDFYGDTPIDKVLKSEKVVITANLAEEVFSNLGVGLPEARYETGVNGSRVEFGHTAGDQLSNYAKQLVIHPIKNSDQSEDITIYRAISTAKVTLDYTFDKQRIIMVTFDCLIDETKALGDRLGHFGVPSIS